MEGQRQGDPDEGDPGGGQVLDEGVRAAVLTQDPEEGKPRHEGRRANLRQGPKPHSISGAGAPPRDATLGEGAFESGVALRAAAPDARGSAAQETEDQQQPPTRRERGSKFHPKHLKDGNSTASGVRLARLS